MVENLEKGVSEGLVVKANTIEELADLLKVNKDNLVGTVNKYNEAFNSGNDAEFGLKNKQMTPMLKAPFYAYDVKPTIIGTIKGVKVNISKVEILDSKDTAGISDAAIEKLPEMIVSKNSPEVDSISGATSTSDAIKEAVTEALKQAK